MSLRILNFSFRFVVRDKEVNNILLSVMTISEERRGMIYYSSFRRFFFLRLYVQFMEVSLYFFKVFIAFHIITFIKTQRLPLSLTLQNKCLIILKSSYASYGIFLKKKKI